MEKTGTSLLDRIFNGDIEHYRFGVISAALLIVGCMGGIAVFSGAMSSAGQLVAVLIPTMATLASLLAVAPVKQIVYFGLAALLVDIIVICLNAF